MFKRGSCKINFVCLDDITEKRVDLNSVVYNPAVKDIDTRKRILFDSIHNNFKIDLTDTDLDRLCHYESDKLYDFINDIKNILFG